MSGTCIKRMSLEKVEIWQKIFNFTETYEHHWWTIMECIEISRLIIAYKKRICNPNNTAFAHDLLIVQ